MYLLPRGILFMLVSAMLGISCNHKPAQQSAASVQTIQPGEVAAVLKNEKALLLDVRTPEEVANGIINGTTLFADIKSSAFEAQIAALDKNKAYVVYCRSGARSNQAAQYMLSQGFTRVYNLEGGVLRWPAPLTLPQSKQ